MRPTVVSDIVIDGAEKPKFYKAQKLPGKHGTLVVDQGATRRSAYAVIGDLHVGPRRSYGVNAVAHDNAIFRALETALDACYGSGIRSVILAGDIFDRVSIAPRYVQRTNRILARFFDRGMSVVAIAGNHDTRRDESALWYLPDRVECVDNPRVLSLYNASASLPVPKVLVVPFVPGLDASSAIDEAISVAELEASGSVSAMVMHYGVHYDGESWWMRNDPSFVSAVAVADRCKSVGIGIVIAGHRHSWHCGIVDGVSVVCIGSLAPRSSSEVGYSFGNVAIVGNTLSIPSVDVFTNVASGPRFLDADDVRKHGTKGCWALLTGGDGGLDFKSPEDSYDTIDRVTVMTRGVVDVPKACVVSDVGSVERAVSDYIIDDVCSRDKLMFGVLREALARLSGSAFTLGITKPIRTRRL